MFLVDTDKMIPKFIWKSKGTIIAKTILKMKNKVVEISHRTPTPILQLQ